LAKRLPQGEMTMRRHVAGAASLIALAVCTAPSSWALSFSDIAGQWCNSEDTVVFGLNSITTTMKDGSTDIAVIEDWDFRNGTARVIWHKEDGWRWGTDYGEFSADGQRMVQLPTMTRGRIPHSRCGLRQPPTS